MVIHESPQRGGGSSAPLHTRPALRANTSGVLLAALYLVSLTMVLIASRPLADADVWWHLVMGHAYLDGTSIRHPGAMSPFGTEDWHSRDWMVQLVMAGFEDAFGLPGVAWLLGLGLAVLVIACFRTCRRLAPFGPSVVATSIAFFSSIGSLAPRPQVVSFILLAVTVSALLATVSDRRPRWWLVLVTGLWACCHGLWFLAPGLQVVVVVGMLLDRRLDRTTVRPHLLLVVACVLAVAMTPNGLHLVTHPLGASMGLAPYVQEYQPLPVSFPPLSAALAMVAVVCLVWARRGGATWVGILLVGTGTLLVLYMGRTLPLGAILVMPYFAGALATLRPWARADLAPLAERVVVLGGAVAVLGALTVLVPTTAAEPGPGVPQTYDTALDAMSDDDVVINELGDGGYLAWRHPGLRITGDGLSDQYSVPWLMDWHQALRGEPGWEDFVERTGADYALLRENTPLRLGLQARGWTTIQSTQDRVLLAAPAG